MFYFKFPIPTMPDGSLAEVPPTWFGEMTFPSDEKRVHPKDVTVDLLNYKEGFGLAKTESENIQTAKGEFELIDEADYSKLLGEQVVTEEKVFAGEKLAHRWDAKPESITDDGNPKAPWMKSKPTRTKRLLFWCSECKELSYINIPETFTGKGTFKTKCPKGHTVSAPMNQADKPVMETQNAS